MKQISKRRNTKMSYELNYSEAKSSPTNVYNASKGYSISCPTCGQSERDSHLGNYRSNKLIRLEDIPVMKLN
jgi:hypothetical protein